MHESQSQEQWLVSSKTKPAVEHARSEVEDLQQRLQLHEILADQLQAQLQQQQREVTDSLQCEMKAQQDMVGTLQEELDSSHSEGEELRLQLAASQSTGEEMRQRTQLQEVLADQLLSQLQDVTRQRDEYEKLVHELRSAITKKSKVSHYRCEHFPADALSVW